MKMKLPRPFSGTPRLTALSALLSACAAGSLSAQTIPNPGFEADSFTVFPGYVSGNGPITGWTGGPDANYGLNPGGGSPFANNGTIPQGTNVALIQSQASGTPTRLATTISGLTANSRYRLTFRANARGGQSPVLNVTVGAIKLLRTILWNVGGTAEYRTIDLIFTATAASMPLVLENDAPGDTTVVVDDFSVTAAPLETWGFAEWLDDSTADVDSQYAYTHLYNFNSTANPVINDLTFQGIGGVNPAIAGKFTYTGVPNGFANDGNNIGDGGRPLANDFIYGGDPATLALEGLKPSTAYVLNLYSVGFDDPPADETAPPNNRWVDFRSGNDGLSLDQDAFGNNNGIRVFLKYTSDAAGKISVTTRGLGNGTFHSYGFSNHEAVASNFAPSFTTQPAGAKLIVGDDTLTLSATAQGNPPPAVQWFRNGTALPGETTNELLITASGAAEAGAYTLKATNSQGTATSNVAFVEVYEPKAGPLFSTGVDATGSALNPTDGNGNPTPDGHYTLTANPDGNANIAPVVETLIPSPPWIPNTSYSVWVGPRDNTASSAVGLYTYRTTVNVTDAATFNAHALYAVDNLTNSILVNGQPTTGIPLSQGFDRYSVLSLNKGTAPSLKTGANTVDFIVDNILAIGYTGLRLSSVSVPAGLPPVILDQPAGGVKVSGNPASISVRVYGSDNLTYQWTRNGTAIPGAVSSTYNINAFSAADLGTYKVTATNSVGSAVSGEAILSSTDVPVSITAQPVGGILAPGNNITLSVSAAGSTPITWQWAKNGADLPGATASTLTLSSVSPANDGKYTVKATNLLGSLVSSPAAIYVRTPVPAGFNSGVDNSGVVLDDASEDPHYTLIFNPDGANDVPALVHSSTVFPIVAGPWLANSATSKWIAPQIDTAASVGETVDAGAGPGIYVYRTTIDLTGFDASSAVITGSWTSDNNGQEILVNGNPTGITNGGDFGALSPFLIDGSMAQFTSGVNTIDFQVLNLGGAVGPTALRVDGLRVYGIGAPASNLPPISIALSPAGKPVISFTGTPGVSYPVQRSTTLTPSASWSVIGEAVAPANGQVSFEDPNPPVGRAFYRVVFPQ